MQKETYNTLEDLQLRRDELSDAIDKEGEQIMDLWHSLYKKEEDSTRGEYIVSIINNSIMAIDAFLLVRKLFRNYNHLFDFLIPSKKKRSHRK
jgi:hypothetical protein